MNNLETKIADQRLTDISAPKNLNDVGFDYTSDFWTIDIPRMSETIEINYNQRFGELQGWQKKLVKAYVKSICQQHGNVISFSKSEGYFSSLLTHLKLIIRAYNEYYSTKRFCDLSDKEILHIVSTNESGAFAAKGTIEMRGNIINALFDLQFHSNHLIDVVHLPARKFSKDWEKLVLQYFAPPELDEVAWIAGGTFDKVPFEVSLALLCYCVEILKSDKTKYLLAWCKWQREYQNGKIEQNAYNRVLKNFGRIKYHKLAVAAQQIDAEYFECLQHYYPDAKHHSDLPLTRSNIGPIPFNFDNSDSENGFISNVQQLVTTCYVAMLILTGARRSELASIRTDGIQQNGEHYNFFSGIAKTQHGVEKSRTIGSFLVPEILKVLDEVSFDPLSSSNRDKLFSYSVKSMGTDTVPIVRKSRNIHQYMDTFYENFLKTDGQHLREICDHINAHAFRHTWVEFAMRRFDGNIMPLIMDRLAHSGQHTLTFTPAYTDNKISMSEYKKLGKEWMVEIVKRYVDEPDVHAVFGAVGDKIRNLVDDLNILDLQNEYERDERVHEVVDEVFPDNILKPSSTVICCLREGRQQFAQCYNKTTGVAMTSMAKTPQCCACENGLICQSQLAQFELTLEDYEERYQQHQLGALANKLRAEANEDNPFGAVFAEQARKDFTAMQKMKQKIDKIRGSK